MIEFSADLPQLLALLSGVILPLIVGFFTTVRMDSGVKAIVLAALALGINLATEAGQALASGSSYDLGAALFAGLGTFLIAVGTHYGFWKPTAVTDKVQHAGVKDKSVRA